MTMLFNKDQKLSLLASNLHTRAIAMTLEYHDSSIHSSTDEKWGQERIPTFSATYKILFNHIILVAKRPVPGNSDG